MQSRIIRPRSPHILPSGGPVIDFNGTGVWSAESIRKRYKSFATEFEVESPAYLVPLTHSEGERTWVYSLLDRLYPLIEAGDAAATELGVELIEEDAFFCFGRMLKINMAQALRQGKLTPEQQQRIRKRIVNMLLTGNVPLEFREYKRLLRHVGMGQFWPILDAQVDRGNQYVMRHYVWLDRNARSEV